MGAGVGVTVNIRVADGGVNSGSWRAATRRARWQQRLALTVDGCSASLLLKSYVHCGMLEDLAERRSGAELSEKEMYPRLMDKVYVLTNQAMPGMVKIGITSKDSVETRMKDLDATGVPLPFECYYAAEVEDAQRVERALHSAFDDVRVRRGREFFDLDPNKAKGIIELLAVNDVTPRNEVIASEADSAALLKRKGKSGLFKFSTAEIPVGATLAFSRGDGHTATVIDDRNILFCDHATSLSNAALRIMRELGYEWKTIDGTAYWLYEGQSVGDRRREVQERCAQDES
jgi:hypothetical protein